MTARRIIDARIPSSYLAQRYAAEFRATCIEEGVHDPAIMKAIFVVGGGGSGKGFIVQHTIEGLGFKHVNSDHALEYLMKQSGMGLDMRNLPPDAIARKDEIRTRAKGITQSKKDLYYQGGLGMVIDGTGYAYESVRELREEFVNRGYDTFMVLVNTPLRTAIERNSRRERKVPEDVITRAWHGVQDNIGKFSHLFGSNFIIVDNSRVMTPNDPVLISVRRRIMAFVKQ